MEAVLHEPAAVWLLTHPSRKLSKLDEPDMQDTARKARTNSSVMYSYGPPHTANQKQDDQLEHLPLEKLRFILSVRSDFHENDQC